MNVNQHLSKYKISRRGRKLQVSDDSRTLVALPKEVPERIWAEVLQKEENDMLVLEIREEILEDVIKIVYDKYMERQNALFTAHCAAEAWLKLIDWQFYRHDPGEEASASPACFIPRRAESWVADAVPAPSPRDTWARQALALTDDTPTDSLRKWPSNSSIDYPIVEDIPEEYWFPGKVNLPVSVSEEDIREQKESLKYRGRRRPLVQMAHGSAVWDYVQEESESTVSGGDLTPDSELLQKVTDYSTDELTPKESAVSAVRHTTPVEVEGSLRGAGDSLIVRQKRKLDKSKMFSKSSMLGRSKGLLAPVGVESRSRFSVISDCRLRNLRLETQFEISSEKVDSIQGEVKRK